MARATMAEQTERGAHEIAHGDVLLAHGPEAAWGWATPAGRLRAARRAQLILDGARVGPDSRVLEVGCGTGHFTQAFAERGAEILAVDISPVLLDQARARELPNARVRFECRRFEDCDIEGPFDAVIGSSILHHLDVAAALRKIFSLLKPGGYLSFAEPNMLNPQVFAERKLRFLRSVFWYVSPDETAFVRWRLKPQLCTCGFTEIRITPFDWLHPATPPKWVAFVRGLGGLLETLPGAREFAGSLLITARRPP